MSHSKRSTQKGTTPSKAPKSLSWAAKMQKSRKQKLVVLDKPFAGIPAGSTLLVATPALVAKYIDEIPRGETRTVVRMRNELARRHRAQATCPVSTGIFLRIVAEASLEALASGKGADEVTPFWRVVEPTSALAKKLSCDEAFLKALIEVEQR
jgi:hypothetical protein